MVELAADRMEAMSFQMSRIWIVYRKRHLRVHTLCFCCSSRTLSIFSDGGNHCSFSVALLYTRGGVALSLDQALLVRSSDLMTANKAVCLNVHKMGTANSGIEAILSASSKSAARSIERWILKPSMPGLELVQ